MKRLDRYILFSLCESYVICIGLALLFYMILDLFSKFNKFVEYVEILQSTGQNPGSVWWMIGKYYAYQSPLILHSLTPIITLMAAMFTTTRMARANELTPLKACGIPMWRLMYPFVGFGLLACAWMAILQESVIPQVESKIEEMDRVQHGRKMELSGIQYCDDLSRIFFYVGRYYPPTLELQEIRVITPYPKQEWEEQRILEAKIGQWVDKKRKHYLRLLQGRQYLYDKDGGLLEDLPLPKEGYELETNFRDLHITYPEEKHIDTLPTRKLLKILKEKPNFTAAIVTLHTRFSFPLGNIVLILLGVPWIFRARSRNFFVGITICIVAAGAFYGMHLLCCNLGYKGILNPVFSAWFALICFGSLGASFITLIPT